jgi:hypothetical protein
MEPSRLLKKPGGWASSSLRRTVVGLAYDTKTTTVFAAVKGLGQHSIRTSRYHSRSGKLTFEGSSKRWADAAVERAQWCYEAVSCESRSAHASSICLLVREKSRRADSNRFPLLQLRVIM